MKILVLNSGSSSIKYKIFSLPKKELLGKGSIENIGEEGSAIQDHYTGLKKILGANSDVDAVGHRVVHGGEAFQKPVRIDETVIRKIRQCCEIAPLHNPANLSGILACKKLMPSVPQVAVFDTAFHQTIPDYAYVYGLPYAYYQKMGIRKYGFHGTSHHYVAVEAARQLKRPLEKLKLITCHLGNGCSITAVDGGRSVDTSMGYTPLEGVIMGTRCGDIDPALIPYLMHKKKLDVEGIERVLNKESGLKGISGISNDMRTLTEHARKGNPRARLALQVFIYRIGKYIGAYVAAMGGCDAIIFTGGIGENQKDVRTEACRGILNCLKKRPKVLVIPTNEELMISLQTYKVIHNGS
jgi:acetate kinase